MAQTPSIPASKSLTSFWRIFAGGIVATALLFLVNNVLTFWFDWPGAIAILGQLGIAGAEVPNPPLQDSALLKGWVQVALYLAAPFLFALWVNRSSHRLLRDDAQMYTALAAYIVRVSFFSVLLIGIADMAISFLRVEDILPSLISAELNSNLGRQQFRGQYVHYPLMAVSVIIALFTRAPSFIWLALLVVLAEFQIVISRFVFSYEQAFMGDLVRFWYAALFLFASARTLIEEGHVRVDVIYAHFSKRGKAWANVFGAILLGLPLCGMILVLGMWGKGSSLNSPLLSFEISQSSFGLYVKYLMAGFLVIFAISMVIQFTSFLLHNLATLRGEPDPEEDEQANLVAPQEPVGMAPASYNVQE